MKRLVCALLTLCLLLTGVALAEETQLPVLVAQLGKSAVLIEIDERGDEYLEVLMVDEATVVMGRFAGEISAEALALQLNPDIRDGEALAGDEIDDRAVYRMDEADQVMAMDVAVIHLDGYTYAFIVVVSEDAYLGSADVEPFRELIDFWVSTLEVFDGDPAPLESGAESIMLLFDSPLYNDAEMIASEENVLLLSAAGGAVTLGEYTLPPMDAADIRAALLSVAQQIHPDAAEFTHKTAVVDGHPAYICCWSTPETRSAALVVAGETTLVMCATADANQFDQYSADIDALIASASVFSASTEIDLSSVIAEEIAYQLLDEYAEFRCVRDEVFEGETYRAYEFLDDTAMAIGVIAVQPVSGQAYISFGTDALAPVYEEVYFDPDTGYFVGESVG